MTQLLQQVQEAYSRYFTALEAARAKLKPSDGIFGFGTKLSDDRCNADFTDAIQALLSEAAQAGPSAEEAEEAIGYVCRAPKEQGTTDEVSYWLLMAVQQYAQPLLPALPREKAQALCAWYREAYPWNERLPVQQAFFAALCACAGESPRPKPFWRR